MRLGNVNLKDSFVRIKNNEVYVENMHIAPYDHGNIFNHEARRTRKLLLHKKEILKITNKLKEGGLTVVPTKMYFSGSKAKLEIALAKGKKLYDKRNDLKEKAAKRKRARGDFDFPPGAPLNRPEKPLRFLWESATNLQLPNGPMCTGKRQTHIRNAPSSRTAVTGIGPYEASWSSGRYFNLGCI